MDTQGLIIGVSGYLKRVFACSYDRGIDEQWDYVCEAQRRCTSPDAGRSRLFVKFQYVLTVCDLKLIGDLDRQQLQQVV